MTDNENIEIVFPGETVSNDILKSASIKNKVKLGPGLKRAAEDVVSIKAGILRTNRESNTVWVDYLQKQYIPTTNETVVGIVSKKSGDFYKVEIQAADQALLHYLSFEGATKKNRPEINIGDAIFGRLVVVSPDMEPELVCMTVTGKKEYFRVLPNDGFLFRVSLHLVRKLLSVDTCPLLDILGSRFKFESAIGMNGFIWIKGETIKDTITIATAILQFENQTTEEIKNMFH
ncbi:exosome complex component RRP40 [Cimex lectularius]|uniref:Exosome complex component RRP40 n=1 Tax=Cimex lectularius TaxID=79782 RepID=A0A8I6TFE1_CIMLE|nr:exosome complex component RRP40 [Cimex lectularius]